MPELWLVPSTRDWPLIGQTDELGDNTRFRLLSQFGQALSNVENISTKACISEF